MLTGKLPFPRSTVIQESLKVSLLAALGATVTLKYAAFDFQSYNEISFEYLYITLQNMLGHLATKWHLFLDNPTRPSFSSLFISFIFGKDIE